MSGENKPVPPDRRRLRIGVAGLGRAFTLMLPTFLQDPRVHLVAACDPQERARERFAQDFGAPAFATIDELCAQTAVDVVYVATPHQFHAAHVCLAAASGKHVLVEKPMAITLAECDAMISAARAAGTVLIVGHSHSFNAPVRRAAELLRAGVLGTVRMIHAFNYTDFLYRPRRPEELDTGKGGGVVFSQAAHQIDVVRLLAGSQVRSVRAHTGSWDLSRPAEGAYSVLLGFENGAFASATYSGYGHFDSDALMDWTGEMGQPKTPQDYGQARRRLATAADAIEEIRLKAERNYGGALYQPAATASPAAHQHFGHVVVSCDRGDIRLTARSVEMYGHEQMQVETLPVPSWPRAEVIDELWHAVVEGHPPVHDGIWARDTLAVCLGLLRSAQERQDIILT